MINLTPIWIFLITTYSSAFENLALNKPAWQRTNWPDKPILWGAAKAVDGLYTDRSAGGNQCSIAGEARVTAEWRVDLGSVVSISHINIFYRTDNLPSPGPYYNRFAGFFVYVSNTTQREDGYLCFHEIQQVDRTPTENQTITCPVHGRYVIVYNERRQDVTYPSFYSQYVYNELCEVEVYGCPVQRYGENCDLPCPQNCQEQRCAITTGECLGCVPGYQGPRCSQACGMETYGLECTSLCGNCSDSGSCDNVNGTCLSGCKEGVQGDKCQTPCQAGHYGEGCVQNCSSHCYVSSHCNRFNGECLGGCDNGWKNLDCEQECDDGKYGFNCNQSCGHCLNGSQCDKIDGRCINGCSSGFMGNLCDKECPHGFFGINCLGNCMTYCGGNRSCDPVTGVCHDGCIEGLNGALCNEEKPISNPCTCNSDKTSIIIGVIISVVIVVIGSLINFILWKRNQSIITVKCDLKSSADQKDVDFTDIPSNGHQGSSIYAELGALDKHSTYEELHQYAEAVNR